MSITNLSDGRSIAPTFKEQCRRPAKTMLSTTPAMETFITAERFAVIGSVLTDRSRFDNKVSITGRLPSSPRLADIVLDQVLRWSGNLFIVIIARSWWGSRYQTHDLPVTPIRPSASPSDTAESLPVLSDPVRAALSPFDFRLTFI